MQNTFVYQLNTYEQLNFSRELSESPVSHPCKVNCKLIEHTQWNWCKLVFRREMSGSPVSHLATLKTVNNEVSDSLVITREMSGSPVGHPCKHWLVNLLKTCEKKVLAGKRVGHQWVTHASIDLSTYWKHLNNTVSGNEWVTSESPMKN